VVSKMDTLNHEMTKQDLEIVFNNSIDGIYVTNGEGFTIGLNKASEQNYNVKAENVIGKHVKFLEEQGVFSPSVALKVIQSKTKQTLIQTCKSGKTILATGNPIFDNNKKLIRVICNSRDISELNNWQEVTEDKDEFDFHKYYLMPKNNRSKQYEVFQTAKKAANVNIPVTITGESGTGKDVLARYIHSSGSRSSQRLVQVNCAAIPHHLFESELFGYSPGAFSGASRNGKKGLMEAANQGILFLDEIGDLPLPVQAKLLNALERYEITPVGDTRPIPIDFRLICATNIDLKKKVEEKSFRNDLYYRIAGVTLNMPPLRACPDEIPLLAEKFLEDFSKENNLFKKFDKSALDFLLSNPWPGNIRELKYTVQKVALLSETERLTYQDFSKSAPQLNMPAGTTSLKEAVARFEKSYIEQTISERGSTRKAAKALETSHSTVMRKLKQ
jgi:TyrR family helix-turn-helix protein/PAS domain S-box-containing protein